MPAGTRCILWLYSMPPSGSAVLLVLFAAASVAARRMACTPLEHTQTMASEGWRAGSCRQPGQPDQ